MGSTAALGDWNLSQARRLAPSSVKGVWTTDLAVPEDAVEYKYVVLTAPAAEPHLAGSRLLSIAPAAPAAPESLFFNETSYVPYLREPASAFGKKTVKLWTTKATTTKVTATKKSLWRMYAADKTRELFD